MHTARITFAAVVLSLSASAAVSTGSRAPDFSETDATGAVHSLDQYKGKTVILEWTNHRCPFVEKHYSSKAGRPMQSLQSSVADTLDVVWLSVISSAPGKQGHVSGEKAQKLAAQSKAKPHAILLDSNGDMGRRYGAKTTPHMFVISPDGLIAYQGAIDSIRSTRTSDVAKADNYVAAALAALADGRKPDPDTTAPYGCSVKY